MSTNWKRLTFGALMLASLTLFLFGCGGGGSTQVPASKPVSGVVADPATGLPLANVKLTAFAIGADGKVSGDPLSFPADVRSDAQGNYTLNIPLAYAGSIMIVATLPNGTTISSPLLPVQASQTDIPPAMVNLATDLIKRYIDQNLNGVFTPVNIQTAIIGLEPYFGTDFTQIPPPTAGTPLSPLQQDMITMTQAINLLTTTGINGTIYTLDGLIALNGGTISMGQDPALTDLQAALAQVASTLIANGTLPGDYTPPATFPAPGPGPGTDVIPPSPPTNLTATSTANTVTLSWTASASDDVSYYLVYRNGQFIKNVAAPADTTTPVSYTDLGLTPDTLYTYEVRARDTSANLSQASNAFSIRTTVIQTFTISGTITIDGGKPSVGTVFLVVITGTGSGIAFTDADGKYTFSGALPGDYTITPSLLGVQFNPTSRPVTVSNANVTGVDFAATTITPGSVIGGVVYPDGVVIGGVTYPPGTIVGGITYPSGVVIGGVTYPTSTVAGNVTYPTGSVIGGILYPNGVVIGGVEYPPGTVVGGIATPPAAVTGGTSFPGGSVTGTVNSPGGSVTGVINYPEGTVTGTINSPTGSIAGTTTAPSTGTITVSF